MNAAEGELEMVSAVSRSEHDAIEPFVIGETSHFIERKAPLVHRDGATEVRDRTCDAKMSVHESIGGPCVCKTRP